MKIKKAAFTKGKSNELPAGISRRDFLKYSGAAGGALLMSLPGGMTMANARSRVAFLKTEDRKSAVLSSIKALNINPAKNKDVLIKPNFNTADPVPGSTHNDTLVSLVEAVWSMGAKSISLGERSYPLTRDVMEKKGIIPLMKKLDVKIINFDQQIAVLFDVIHLVDGITAVRAIVRLGIPVIDRCSRRADYVLMYIIARIPIVIDTRVIIKMIVAGEIGP